MAAAAYHAKLPRRQLQETHRSFQVRLRVRVRVRVGVRVRVRFRSSYPKPKPNPNPNPKPNPNQRGALECVVATCAFGMGIDKAC